MMRNLKEEYNYKTLQPKQRSVSQLKEQPYVPVQGLAKIQNMNARSDRSLGQSSSELNRYDAYKSLESRNEGKQSKSLRSLEKPPLAQKPKPIPIPTSKVKLKSIQITEEESSDRKTENVVFML